MATGLENRTIDVDVSPSGGDPVSLVSAVLGFLLFKLALLLLDLLPNIVVNGLLFVLPGGVGRLSLGVVLAGAVVTTVLIFGWWGLQSRGVPAADRRRFVSLVDRYR